MTQGVRYLYGDTETTGFDPGESQDRIVEIAMVECVDDRLTGRVYHQYVNPQRPMPEDAFKVHGLSDEFLADKPTFDQVADEFLAFVNGADMVFHNAEFDMKFIRHHVTAAGRRPTWRSHQCTLVLAKDKLPKSRLSLDALIARFGIDGSERKKHGALIDSKLLAEVHAHLLGKRSLALVHSQDAHADKAVDAEAFPDWRHDFDHGTPSDAALEAGQASLDEIAIHRAYVAKRLKKPGRWTGLHAEVEAEAGDASWDGAPLAGADDERAAA